LGFKVLNFQVLPSIWQSSIKEEFDKVDNAFKGVQSKVKTKSDTSYEWDVEEAKSKLVTTCLKHAQEFLVQEKLLALKERAHHGLLTKFETINSKIQIAFPSLENATSH
jgi:hypothetical protein